MSKESLNVTEQPISIAEKKKLLLSFVIVLVVGVSMASITYYVIVHNSDGLPIPVVVFLFFFGAVLLFIMSTRFIHIFQKSKLVYVGLVTDKQEETTKFRKGQAHSRFFVFLDGEPFVVDHYFYNKVNKGERVELHCFKDQTVFHVINLNSAENHIYKQADYPQTFQIESDRAFSKEIYRQIIQKKAIGMFWLRGVLLGVLLIVLYFVITLALLMSGTDVSIVAIGLKILPVLLVLGWLSANRKTIYSIIDLFAGREIIIQDRVVDVVQSNTPKPSKNSITTGHYTRSEDRFYYLETVHHWLPISEALYNSLIANDIVEIVKAKNSGVVLDVVKI